MIRISIIVLLMFIIYIQIITIREVKTQRKHWAERFTACTNELHKNDIIGQTRTWRKSND